MDHLSIPGLVLAKEMLLINLLTDIFMDNSPQRHEEHKEKRSPLYSLCPLCLCGE
ncbi:hypothetical protein [Planktothricoides raciborskii]|uniref:Uncharacterized protein n=1 Tax=Planktothricoides raciborskii FACHB-1370 TaxID=2949576 RepID=A0ABR8EA40_9CYAN|nr:hypothetical protein [Planktothricoides raciborskii]MBD2543445.1 hypothetical protein [Planktothricoides raciborskii FACHB-1370]MBD2581744.1 hypothetical protein [Planktothricoides raciborskii FACHB-1261]